MQKLFSISSFSQNFVLSLFHWDFLIIFFFRSPLLISPSILFLSFSTSGTADVLMWLLRSLIAKATRAEEQLSSSLPLSASPSPTPIPSVILYTVIISLSFLPFTPPFLFFKGLSQRSDWPDMGILEKDLQLPHMLRLIPLDFIFDLQFSIEFTSWKPSSS